MSGKKISRSISPFKELKLILGSKNDLARPKINFEESSYFSNVRKNSKKNVTFLVRILV